MWIKQLGDESLGAASAGFDDVDSIAVDDSGIYLGGYTQGSLGETHGGDSDPFMD